ncbi:ABC transporter permease [Listeria seeligeri]|uniref:ABC transporter permease n=1 Tax=Listeria seeligeri TaxID=1640 RepID=UPI0021AB7EE3|nr:ABC transporter permease [Listeria seeligeri]
MLNNKLYMLITLDIKRVFRDIKYVAFIIILPIFFYIIYNELFATNAAVKGIPWGEYSLVSMISFGIMGNAINLLGTKIADEKKGMWYDYLKVSPISPKEYGISHIYSYLIISILFTVLMFVIGFLYNGVSIDFYKMIEIGILLNIGSIPFLLLALLVGEMGSLAQPFGTIIYLFLSFLGGLWMPIEAMPETMQQIAKILPSYNYANLGWTVLADKKLEVVNFLFLIGYATLFLLVYILLTNRRKE